MERILNKLFVIALGAVLIPFALVKSITGTLFDNDGDGLP
jgi:hypothetical protein